MTRTTTMSRSRTSKDKSPSFTQLKLEMHKTLQNVSLVSVDDYTLTST